MKALVLLVLLLAGCATAEPALDRMQREVQECYLSGGHPRLGPGNTVVCK